MNIGKFPFVLGVLGTALVLLWIGLFKFTPSEAAAIKSLVGNHFAMRWMYDAMSDQMVSNNIGVFEMLTGIGLLLSLYWNKVGIYAGLAAIIIFLTTLSFIFTTPGSIRMVDGIPVTDFFLLKDIPYLAFSIMVFSRGRRK